ncbi:MAG: PD-(D/E)XK nuclease family protein [Erysipelotrichaceae bacterium]|nr:PD-(D/E)XK nuclease family protein [Solobacterium sp.]MDY5402155.1 PD-(D/E)XK nuclease family protein [Erysipelotrichaceae bacterium]
MHQIDIKDNMLLICPRDIKEKILANNKSLVDISFMTLEEYKKRYYFDYDYHTVKYLMDTYGYTLNNAKEIIESLYFVEDKNYPNNKLNDLVKIKKELLDKNLLILDPLFNKHNKDTIVYGYGDIRLNDAKVLKGTIIDKHYNIYEFDTIESELEYVYESIFELLENGIDINNIYIVADNEYENYFKRYNSYYDFKVNYPSDNSLYGTEAAKKFLEDIKLKGRETIYNELTNKDLVNILNKYLDLNEAYDFIVEDLKHIKLNKKYKDVVQVVSNNYLFSDFDYVFYLGFNDKVLAYKKDNEYLDNEMCRLLGIDDTNDKNRIIKENLICNLSNIKNLYLSYSKNSPFNKYERQMLFSDVNYISYTNKYLHSDKSNRNRYGELLDNLDKYGEHNDDLDSMYSTYDRNNYGDYDNSYKNFNVGKETVELSYSSMQSYYECAFKYYLDNILRPDDSDATFFTTIGTIAHNVLQEMVLDNTKDFDELWDNQVTFTSAKELYFNKKIKEEIREDFNIILKQKELSYFDSVECEKRIKLKLRDNIFFKGFIDKILKCKDNLCIVDYKTGNTKIEDKYFEFGLNLQLPSYLYLLQEDPSKIIGFYLQHLVAPKYVYDEKKDIETQKNEDMKLTGFTSSDISRINILEDLDGKSSVVSKLAITKNGELSKNSKVISDEDMKDMIKLVEDKILEASTSILNNDFSINPKVIDNKNVSCTYCRYKDICYKRIKDYVYYETKKEEVKDGN